jgi:hypothetical protein
MMNSSHSMVVLSPCSFVEVMTDRTSGVNFDTSRKGVLNAWVALDAFAKAVGM